MSADKCPSCGCVKWGDGCEDTFRISVERAAEIERLKAMLAPKWTDRRAEQLRDLSGLLRDCNDLDAASCVLARLRRIIAAADRLTTSSMEHIEPSFIEFIESLCRDDRRNQSNQEK